MSRATVSKTDFWATVSWATVSKTDFDHLMSSGQSKSSTPRLRTVRVARLAGAIASEPRITRPGVGSGDELNAELPERFFVLQDELRSKAKTLADAALDAPGDALVQKYSDLTRTCVSCHQSFLDRRTRR